MIRHAGLFGMLTIEAGGSQRSLPICIVSYLPENQMQKLERAQNKALRMLMKRYNSTPAEALQLESGLLPVRHKARGS